jgi:hypothetical protein
MGGFEGASTGAGTGATPVPTVIVWMEEDFDDTPVEPGAGSDSGTLVEPERHVFQAFYFPCRGSQRSVVK